MTAQEFATNVDRLLNQVGHWEQGRWWVHTPLGPTKADLAYALVQSLADLAADAEGRPRRPVPRLTDPVLPDQLRVTSDDLLAAEPGAHVFAQAGVEVDALRRVL
ncbi:hypothetical protein EV385_3967 [Krasilnikovia cinnamomea]|uniref:Uncharacterized protein n=1 Tax=Krasilnikovia cinnamomea TaxID=349313 RepID=A0A4Q7ZNZ8_9ACTN|nr:hypothetical protein [Krasilnikovia cinnamomea]RZU52125.1 hypothetical protein EV385_3967 [Krasilnikovia cinnamomea]